jgi:hypothetical protein
MTFTKKSSFKKPTNTLSFKNLQKPGFYGVFVTILLTNIGFAMMLNRTRGRKVYDCHTQETLPGSTAIAVPRFA